MSVKPDIRPSNPRFSSGPCAKRPGWTLDALSGAMLGRSHRAKDPKAKLAEVIERSRGILGMPADWRLGIVPASDTGAVEMALWSLLGPKGVDILAWESFSKDWATDVTKQLKLSDARGDLGAVRPAADLAQLDPARDVVFVWNGTTSGVRLPTPTSSAGPRGPRDLRRDQRRLRDGPALRPARCRHLVLAEGAGRRGGARHARPLAPRRRAARIPQAAWPMPKIFRMTKDGKLNEGIFKGETINTPSMLAVEDALDGLRWAEDVGGLEGLIARSEANLAAVAHWVDRTPWAAFLAEDPATRSCTSICLRITAPWFTALDADGQAAAAKKLAALLEKEGVALDAASYRDAPPGLRIWGGATVETADIEALLPWLDWAFVQVAAGFEKVSA
jgi:phosphoserine aminotransferase